MGTWVYRARHILSRAAVNQFKPLKKLRQYKWSIMTLQKAAKFFFNYLKNNVLGKKRGHNLF